MKQNHVWRIRFRWVNGEDDWSFLAGSEKVREDARERVRYLRRNYRPQDVKIQIVKEVIFFKEYV